jgi:hypothetical protein
MATLERCNGILIPSLKKAATIITVGGFFAAAVFLAVGLLLPANAAALSTATDLQSSQLLALDTPHPPLPKLRLSQTATTADEEGEMMAALVSQDLTSELNNWTYTASALSGPVSIFNSFLTVFFSIEINFLKAELGFWAGVLQIAGLPNSNYLAAINFLQQALTALNSPASPSS